MEAILEDESPPIEDTSVEELKSEEKENEDEKPEEPLLDRDTLGGDDDEQP
jgi:hypothetical protein